MNFQDISDFLDLVKNPAKAEDLLKQIKNQKAQLDAAIETVGKASEIDKLQTKAVKLVENAEKKAVDIVTAAEASAAKQQEAVDAQAEALRVKEQKVNDFNQETNSRMEQAKATEATFSQRDKALRVREDQCSKEAERLSALIKEYDEKVTKLRSAMGS